MLTLPHLCRQFSTILQQLWELPAGAVVTRVTSQDTEAAGKWGSLKYQTNRIFRNCHWAGIWPRLSQKPNDRSLHPCIFSGISMYFPRYIFSQHKLQSPTLLLQQGLNTSNACKTLAQGRETNILDEPPEIWNVLLKVSYNYHRYHHGLQAGKPHAKSTHMASSNIVLTTSVLDLSHDT